MSAPSSKSFDFGRDLARHVKSRARWGIVLSILTAILGLLLIVYPVSAVGVTTNLFGSILIIAGFSEVGQALRAHNGGSFFAGLLVGLVYVFAGIVVVLSPYWGAALLTGVLGVMLLVEASALTVLASQITTSSGWYLFDAVITAILGVLILIHWPARSLRGIGTVVGVAVLIRGIAGFAIATRLRKAAKAVEEVGDRPQRAA